MQKVAFLIAGAQKCGTTALVAALRQHPDIFIPDGEGHYFDREENFSHIDVVDSGGQSESVEPALPDYEQYHQLFSNAFDVEDGRCVGESTPVYLYWRPAAKRICRYNPEMKIIVLLRCPVARAYSAWNMERSRGFETLPFDEAIRTEPERCREASPLQHRVFSYIDRGFYARQLEHLWRYFPGSQTLILPSKQFRSSPHSVLARVCNFLGVPDYQHFNIQPVHVGTYQNPIPSRQREFLNSVFFRENRRLESMLGWMSSDWLD